MAALFLNKCHDELHGAAARLAQDQNILRLPQRLVAWYLLSTCDAGVNGTSPFLALIYKVRHHTEP